jgi:TonB family protein
MQCSDSPEAEKADDLTIVVEADRSRIESRLADIQKETEKLNVEKKKLAEERSELEVKLLSTLKDAGSPTAKIGGDSLERFEGLFEERSAAILAAIEKGGSPKETRELLDSLKQELRQRDDARDQQERENEERLLRLVEAEKNTQIHDLFLEMKSRFAARAKALEAREQRMVELLTAMQEDDGAEQTRELLAEMRLDMKKREEAFRARETELLAASTHDDVRMVLGEMAARLSAIEKHLAEERVWRTLRAPASASGEPKAKRREDAHESVKIELASQGTRKPPTVKLGEKKAERIHDVLGLGGGAKVGLDAAAIESVVRLRRRDLQYCHEVEQRRQPKLAGKVIVSATVAADGRVTRVNVSQNSTGSESLGQCMIQKIKRWRFPEPGQGSTVVKIPWIIIAGQD